LSFAENYYSLTVCKKWYGLTLKYCELCPDCSRINMIYGSKLWTIPSNKYQYRATQKCYCKAQETYDNYITIFKKDCTKLIGYNDICNAIRLIVIKHNGFAIRHLPKQFSAICVEAVRRHGMALQYVKKQKKNICLAAVKQNGLALMFVNVEFKTDEIIIAAVQQNGLAIKYVKTKTKEICLAAVKQNGLVLKYIEDPPNDMCMEAMRQNYSANKFIKCPTTRLLLKKQYMCEMNK
jgi:hypothetical protein